MKNSQFYHPSRNGASWTTQYQEIPHLLSEPFHQVMHARVGEKLDQVQQILERPSEGEQAPPKCRHKAIALGRVGISQEKLKWLLNKTMKWLIF